jgi:hypothetical protein
VKDATGQRFGRLRVVARLGPTKQGYRYACRCDCGGATDVDGRHLRDGRTKSCGCLRDEFAASGRFHGKPRKLIAYAGAE